MLAHSPIGTFWPMTGGAFSVQLFFMISGFLITFILIDRYSDVKTFFISRFFRVFPVYWVFLILSVAVTVLLIGDAGGPANAFAHCWDKFSDLFRVYLFLTNLFCFGMDLSVFTRISDNGVVSFFDHLETGSTYHAYDFFFIPQAWTLSLEIFFYLIAPFVVRNVWVAAAFLLGSVALRYYIYFFLDLMIDPWTYRFFLTELAFFMGGALSAHLFIRTKKFPISGIISGIAVQLIGAEIVFYELLPSTWSLMRILPDKQIVMFVSFLLLLPLLFRFSALSRIDTFLGELSYPIYLAHLTAYYLAILSVSSSYGQAAIQIAVTIVMSTVCVFYVERPIDRWRHRRFAPNLSMRALGSSEGR